jgi:hypothetical protein
MALPMMPPIMAPASAIAVERYSALRLNGRVRRLREGFRSSFFTVAFVCCVFGGRPVGRVGLVRFFL